MRKILFLTALFLTAAAQVSIAQPSLSRQTVTNIVQGMLAAQTGAKLLSPLAGNNAIPDMQGAAAPDYIGQLGLSYSGGKEAALWFGLSNNPGAAGWDVSDLLFPQGIHQIGDILTMPTNSTAGLKIFMNGNREYTRKFYATNFPQIRNSSEIIVRNMNPYTDGNGIYFPMMGITNTASGTVGYVTNADGGVVYDIDQFGLTIATLPYDYVVGETNMAGSYCIITGVGNQIPLYICQNARIGSEATLGQKAWVCFDPRGIVDSSKPGGTHFQMWIPNVYAVTNSGNKDVFYIDQTTTGARVEVLTNMWMLGGGIYATNYNKSSAFGTGAFYDITKGACLITGTNVQFQWDSGHNSDGCVWSFDAYTLYREAIMQKSGDYACWVHGSTAPWQVKQSSASDLSSALSGQTLTTELLIDASRNFGNFCASNYVQNATRIDGTLAYLNRCANKTSNAYTVLGTESGTWFDNSGNAGASTNTLPAATVGLHYGLDVEAAQNWAFKANGTDTIRNAASVSAAGGLLFASTVGNTVHITCHVAGKWVVDSITGTWTAQ